MSDNDHACERFTQRGIDHRRGERPSPVRGKYIPPKEPFGFTGIHRKLL